MINLIFVKAFTEASRYWHLACNYDRVNPGDSSVKLSENNPHATNYRKALAKLEGTLTDV